MGRRLRGQMQPVLLPRICEYKAFGEEDDHLETESTPKLTKAELEGSTYEDDEGPEEPLLRTFTRENQVRDEELKQTRIRGWKMQKRRVKMARGKGATGRRQLLRKGVKVVSPLFLLRKMRDAYVSVMIRFGNNCNKQAWYAVGARAF